MINKIVELKGGISICRILDKIKINGDTHYLVIDINNKRLTCISPKDILDMLEWDNTSKSYISIKNLIITNGI